MSMDMSDKIEIVKIQKQLSGLNITLERIAGALESIERIQRCDHLDCKHLRLQGEEIKCEGCESSLKENGYV